MRYGDTNNQISYIASIIETKGEDINVYGSMPKDLRECIGIIMVL
jgi:hypothetical protein